MTSMLLLWLATGAALAGEGIDAAQAALAELEPARVVAFERAVPRKARNGSLRYHDPVLSEGDAIPWLITRIADAEEDPLLRHGYAHALIRHLVVDGGWREAWLELASSVDDLETRKQLVAGLAKADVETMRSGLQTAMGESNAEVRALAANTAALHPQGGQVASTLVGLLADGDAEVRSEAVRALGVLRVADALPHAVRLTGDDAAEVRMWALRTVQRLDPTKASQLAIELARDGDAKVARYAQTLL